jgi:hypothetical protein
MSLHASVVGFANVLWARQYHEAFAHVTHGHRASEDLARRIKAGELFTRGVYHMTGIHAQDYIATVMAIDRWRLRYIEDGHSSPRHAKKPPTGGRGSLMSRTSRRATPITLPHPAAPNNARRAAISMK